MRIYNKEHFRDIIENIKDSCEVGTWIVFPKNFSEIVASGAFSGILTHEDYDLKKAVEVVRKTIVIGTVIIDKDKLAKKIANALYDAWLTNQI